MGPFFTVRKSSSVFLIIKTFNIDILYLQKLFLTSINATVSEKKDKLIADHETRNNQIGTPTFWKGGLNAAYTVS